MSDQKFNDLFLHEEVMLIALKDQEGTIHSKASSFRYALAGAILAELAIEGKVLVSEDRREPLRILDTKPVGDPAIDAALAKMAKSKHTYVAENWVGMIASIANLKEQTALSLCRRGILKEEEKKILFIFTSKTYPEVDHDPEDLLLARLEDAIFNTRSMVDARTAMLISILTASSMLSIPFDAKRMKAKTIKKRIEKISEGSMLGGATIADSTGRAIQAAIQQAIMISVTSAVTAATMTVITS